MLSPICFQHSSLFLSFPVLYIERHSVEIQENDLFVRSSLWTVYQVKWNTERQNKSLQQMLAEEDPPVFGINEFIDWTETHPGRHIMSLSACKKDIWIINSTSDRNVKTAKTEVVYNGIHPRLHECNIIIGYISPFYIYFPFFLQWARVLLRLDKKHFKSPSDIPNWRSNFLINFRILW